MKLIHDGKSNWKKTETFKRQSNEIKEAVTAKYSSLLALEQNWFKRILLHLKLQLELRKKIDELSSERNLHITGLIQAK